MDPAKLFVGVDVSSEKLAITIFSRPDQPILTNDSFENSLDGFKKILDWFCKNKLNISNSVVCLEATGVYGEAFCYFFQTQGFKIAVESPLKVKRAFDLNGRKTDAVDSRQIAEYAFRFFDELTYWKPNPDTVEQVRILLSLRDQFTVQSTADKNLLQALQKKPVKCKFAEDSLQMSIEKLNNEKKLIEAEIKKLLNSEPAYKETVRRMISVPGVGLLLAASIFVHSSGFSEQLHHKKLAAYLGICPYSRQSGTSLNAKPKSRGFGPERIRKLLHLAARSVITHSEDFRKYFHQKVSQGKPKMLVLNNVENKILKIMCAVIKSKTDYNKEYRSINPSLLKKS